MRFPIMRNGARIGNADSLLFSARELVEYAETYFLAALAHQT
jgi:hypothetical protein